MNPETASAAGLQDIARQIYEAENETGKSDTVRKAVEEAKKGAVSDAAAEEILKSPQATEYFGIDVTGNMTEAEKTNAVKAAAETVAEAEIRAEEARKAAEKTTTQSEEKPLSTGQFLDEIKGTLGESGQGAFSRVVGDGAGPMTRQAVADRAMAATLIYNAGTNGTAIESIRIENNPLTADEMSAMYSL